MHQRDRTLDIFRGFTIAFMVLVNTPGSWLHLYWPLSHSTWHGITPTDLVFPFFLFAVGSSLFFVAEKTSDHRAAIRKAVRRSLLLFAIGLFLNAYPFNTSIDELRIMGVLQRIAICYLASVLLIICFSPKQLIYFCILTLIAYWYIMGFSVTDWQLENNKALTLDKLILGEQHMYLGYGVPFEPEGILSSLPATISVIAGYLSTLMLSRQSSYHYKTRVTIIESIACITMGLLWSQLLPPNKPLWSSSYVVLSVGFAQLILGLIYLLSRFTFLNKTLKVFEIYGTNPLLIYILSWLFAATLAIPLLDPDSHHSASLSGVFQYYFSLWLPDKLTSLIHAFITVVLFFGLSLFLYRKKLFIKL